MVSFCTFLATSNYLLGSDAWQITNFSFYSVYRSTYLFKLLSKGIGIESRWHLVPLRSIIIESTDSRIAIVPTTHRIAIASHRTRARVTDGVTEDATLHSSRRYRYRLLTRYDLINISLSRVPKSVYLAAAAAAALRYRLLSCSPRTRQVLEDSNNEDKMPNERLAIERIKAVLENILIGYLFV